MEYRYRISRFLKRDLVVRVNNLKDGIVSSSRQLFEFHPTGKVTDEGWYVTDDEVFIHSIKDLTETLPFSEAAEKGLIQDNVEYEYSYCKSCGNSRIKKLEYKLFEVEENASQD